MKRPARRRQMARPLTVNQLIRQLLSMPRGALVTLPTGGEPGSGFLTNVVGVRLSGEDDDYALQYVDGARGANGLRPVVEIY